MTYAVVSAIKQDPWVRDRVAACVAVEGFDPNPESWAVAHSWSIASQSGWDTAWAAAVAAHPDDAEYMPGADPAVITDAMILSAVLSIVALGKPDAGEVL